MSIWYLGPPGDLRPLSCPEPGVSITPVRYGGTHQGLSGARTMDVTGHRSDYQFEYTFQDDDEFAFLEAMYMRMVPGPFRLLDPLKRNRLTPQASRLDVSSVHSSGASTAAPWTYNTDWPSAVSVPGRSAVLAGWSGSALLQFDLRRPTTLIPGETVTASVYLRASANYSANLRLDYYDKSLVSAGAGTNTAVSLTTSWQRFSITRTVPASGVAAGVFTLALGTATASIFAAAPQLERGSSATAFSLGGAAPLVHIDQLSTTSPRFPLRDVSLTLQEA